MMFINISVLIFNICEKKGLKIYAFRINEEFQEKEKSPKYPNICFYLLDRYMFVHCKS